MHGVHGEALSDAAEDRAGLAPLRAQSTRKSHSWSRLCRSLKKSTSAVTLRPPRFSAAEGSPELLFRLNTLRRTADILRPQKRGIRMTIRLFHSFGEGGPLPAFLPAGAGPAYARRRAMDVQGRGPTSARRRVRGYFSPILFSDPLSQATQIQRVGPGPGEGNSG